MQAETCDGSLLEISGRVTITPCCLSGGPPLSLSFYIVPALFCKAILGLPEMTLRSASIQFGSPAQVEYRLLPGDPQFSSSLDSTVTLPLNHIKPILKCKFQLVPLGSVQIPCVRSVREELTKSNLTIRSSSLMVTRLTRCGPRIYLTILNSTSQHINVCGLKIAINPNPAHTYSSILRKLNSYQWLDT